MVEFVKRLDKRKLITFVPYYDKISQKILKVQFGKEIGFTLYLFDLNERKVYWGDYATKKILKIIHSPQIVLLLFPKIYPTLVKIISFLIRRHRKVCPPSEGACKFIKTKEGEYTNITKNAHHYIRNFIKFSHNYF
jgi:predicted DCC family thiol-disulfide oxidoreductase YuxK